MFTFYRAASEAAVAGVTAWPAALGAGIALAFAPARRLLRRALRRGS
jgi:hypothetical protein